MFAQLGELKVYHFSWNFVGFFMQTSHPGALQKPGQEPAGFRSVLMSCSRKKKKEDRKSFLTNSGEF